MIQKSILWFNHTMTLLLIMNDRPEWLFDLYYLKTHQNCVNWFLSIQNFKQLQKCIFHKDMPVYKNSFEENIGQSLKNYFPYIWQLTSNSDPDLWPRGVVVEKKQSISVCSVLCVDLEPWIVILTFGLVPLSAEQSDRQCWSFISYKNLFMLDNVMLQTKY